MKSNLITLILIIEIIYLSPLLYSTELIYIEGSIKDSKTGKPLPYANIQIINTNWGTTSNIDGKFSIVFEPTTPYLKITYIGYESREIKFEGSKKNITIELTPVTLQGKEVIISTDRYSWIEKYILEAVNRKNQFIKQLSHYQVYTYSKTGITNAKPGKDIYILAESVSKIGFVSPDFYREKMLNYKVPPILKNLSLEVFRINQKINIHHDVIKILNLSIISPLHNDPLNYYDYRLIDQNLSGQDTVISIAVLPKFRSKSLFRGKLVFNKNSYQLLEVELTGNNTVSNGMVDSLKVCQKYAVKDTIFNLPTFTKYELRMNVMGLPCYYNQESCFINYVINDPDDIPNALLDNEFIFEPDLTYDIDFQRNNRFKIPLSEKEKTYQERQKNIPTIFNIIPNLIFLGLDFPTSIGNIKIDKFSNWYHFNKVEGHFLGAEYQFFNTDQFNLYTHAGYSFSAKLINYKIHTRYKHFFIDYERQVKNIGNFQYNKSSQTLDAVFSHKDNLHYYLSHHIKTTYTKNVLSNLNFRLRLGFENQSSLQNNSDWSIKKKDNTYPVNYEIRDYNKNYFGITVNYIENHEYNKGKPILYKKNPFVNISLDYVTYDKGILKSTENLSILNFDLHRFQPIYNALSVNLLLNLHLQDETRYLQELNFVNKEYKLVIFENSLSFFTLKNYDYIIQDYLRLKSDVTFFNLPRIRNFRLSVGGLLSYLRPLKQIDTPYFNPLTKNFYEYGISIKGISFFDVYVLTNNFKSDNLFIGFKVTF